MLAPMESNILSFFFNTVPLPLFPALQDSDVARVCEATAATLQSGASARIPGRAGGPKTPRRYHRAAALAPALVVPAAPAPESPLRFPKAAVRPPVAASPCGPSAV
jgi:hypothetical protein